MLRRYLILTLFFILFSSVSAREYLVNQVLPAEQMGAGPEQVTLSIYAAVEGGNLLEAHVLPANQWQLQEVSGQILLLHAYVDTHLSQPLWAEVNLDGQTLAPRSELRSIGGVTTEGEIHSKTGFRFPDDSLQTSAVDTQALDLVMGGTSSCPAGSSIRAIDASGNVTCETDDVGSGTVTRVDTGVGLTGGPVTATGTVSVASSGIVSSMIQDGTVGSADINANQVQRRVSGSCGAGQFIIAVNADGTPVCAAIYDFLSVPPVISSVDDPVNNVGYWTSVAIGKDGLPVISYQDTTAGALKVAKCNDVACAGGNETITTVDDPVNSVGSHTSIAIGTDGYPVISYYDSIADALKVAKCNDAACSGGDETISFVDDPVNNVGYWTSIAIGKDGLPVISYYDSTAFALKVAKCNDAACSGGNETITTVDDPTNSVGQCTSIAIGNDGYPVISYRDAVSASLKIAKCNDVACTGGNETITTVDNPANNVGWYTSIAIGTDGLPVISYRDATGASLKVAKCNDAACAGGDETITIVDDPANSVGWYTSIAIGSDGLPVISYKDSTAGALKVAKCNDAACAGGDETITTVDDPVNVVGSYTSIAIGTDGLPVISYQDGTAGALKVTKCFNPACN